MDDLYHQDILLWSEQQAENLRRRAANSLDWDNLAEEIDGVGRGELRAVESHLIQALLHMLKVTAWPSSREVPHWRAEIRGQRDDAKSAFTPAMAQRIDVPALYQRALRRMPETIDAQSPQPVPDICPVSLDQLLDAHQSLDEI